MLLSKYGHFGYNDTEHMPVLDRKALLRVLMTQLQREKEAIEKAQQGDKEKQSILRVPEAGEVYGRSDLEKQGAPQYTARFVKGQEMKKAFLERQSQNQGRTK